MITGNDTRWLRYHFMKHKVHLIWDVNIRGKFRRSSPVRFSPDFDSQDWQPYYAPCLLLILLWAPLPWPPRERHLIFSPPSSLSMRPSVVQNEFSLICMTDKRILYLFNRRSYATGLEERDGEVVCLCLFRGLDEKECETLLAQMFILVSSCLAPNTVCVCVCKMGFGGENLCVLLFCQVSCSV